MTKFDTTPKPYFIQAMRNQAWTITGALAELVDNSFGPGRGDASTCHITYNPRTRQLMIVDDGVGMPSIGRLFQLGNTVGRAPGDIGLYGSGGTMAIMWLADAVGVATLRDGKVSSDIVNWVEALKFDAFPKVDESWQSATVTNTPPELLDAGHGTAISVHLDSVRGRVRTDNVKRDLAKIYAPGIRAGKKIVWTTVGTGTEVLADPIVMPGDGDKVVNLDFALEYGDELLPISGQVGIVDGITVNDAGVHVGYGSRVIAKTKDCFVSADGAEKFTGSSVVGWLDLGDGWQPYLSTTKTTLNDKPLWDVLMGYVFDSIKPLLEEADDEKLMLELDEIALSLQHLFDGTASVAVKRKEPTTDETDELGPGDADGEKPAAEPSTPLSDLPEKSDKPATAQIQIEALPEESMPFGVLCYAESAKATISVSVNKDHPIVELAMLQRPTNRALLNQIIVSEVANVLAPDVNLIDLAFKKRDATSILDITDPEMRERKVLRMLADNIKAKAS